MVMTTLGYWVLIVSFAKGETGGLYLARLDAKTQTLSLIEHITDGVNRPIFARFSADGKQLFVVDNDGDDTTTKFGALAVFSFDRKTGKLALQGRTSTLGRGSCYVGLTSNHLALIANYSQGNVSAIPCDATGPLAGSIAFEHTGSSIDPRRQKGPHPHSFVPSPDGHFALSADLGTDEVSVYPLSEDGKISDAVNKIKAVPGAGPRHIAFSPDGKLMFFTNEMHNTLASFQWDEKTGTAVAVDVQSALPADFTGSSSAADIYVHPDLPVIYTSNRGLDSIAVFNYTGKGKLALNTNIPTGGGHPRGMMITNDGLYLFAANRDANNVVLFTLDEKTGLPTNTGKQLTIPMPMCITTLIMH
jgi:6-phosphogluconolactonase